jgi:hypothetical protein
METVTIAKSPHRRLAKIIRADGTVTSYDQAKYLDLHELPMADLGDLSRILKWLGARPDCAILRGAIADPTRARAVRRLLHPDDRTGEPATLREIPRRWTALDVDGLPLPAEIDLRDLVACAKVVLPHLPAAFAGAAAVVQATASHGLKSGARLRLWHWLSAPMGSASLRQWLAGVPVDPALFSAAQLHFTAAPIFIGQADHLPHRLAVLPGAPCVLVPPPAPALRPSAPPAAAREPSGYRRLDGLIQAVRHAPQGQRHPVLYWAARRAGELARGGAFGAEAAAQMLARAAMDAGGADRRSAERTARDGIRRGMGG